MEKSALVYIVLTAVTFVFGCFVSNSAYTAGYLSGRRLPGASVGYEKSLRIVPAKKRAATITTMKIMAYDITVCSSTVSALSSGDENLAATMPLNTRHRMMAATMPTTLPA